ncbi:Tex family protein [Aerococcus sp. UMB7834]|uniref:Tex family protein n=1 Tax=Aerococcus sp. UMB7834 TaxID=3046342 RepID=UPI00255069C0|nr:Tex family protein [Aerococcus sp. UMB7834]MDK6804319.1 Tex family protein [Aerococcus sp. UMB7834]
MNEDYLKLVHQEMPTYSKKQIQSVLSLLEEGNTVPFIARYRKEQTGSLDEVEIRKIQKTYDYIENLEKRRETILDTIEAAGKLEPKLKKEILKADKLQELEDLYEPYKPKRRTKATIAKDQGLEGLAEWLYASPKTGDPKEEAAKYVTDEVTSLEEALAGAHEILCEWISETARYRQWLRRYVKEEGRLVSEKAKGAEDNKQVYKVYYDFSQALGKLKPYQVLALNRGEKEKILRLNFEFDEFPVLEYLVNQVIDGHPVSLKELQAAIQDAMQRFLLPAVEREIRSELTEEAEAHAIETFSDNLYHLLMQAPLKGRVVLGLDPAFRTGCKLAVVDETGKFLDKAIIYPTHPVNKVEEAAKIFGQLVEKYGVEMVAIGNGTASRESEQFVADQIQNRFPNLKYMIVNESGASVYSASKVARAEFPDFNVEERSAVSIARRLQDPLAELVKIDPKSIGVGQYQHDVSQKELSDSLDFTVETVVNRVGVNLNTASPSLLVHVSGVNKSVAKNIVAHRNDNGLFKNRKELKDVSRLGPKAFEQCAGFLRILNGEEVLDATAIHPESYKLTNKILADQGIDLADIHEDAVRQQIKHWNISRLAADYQIGEESLTDIQDSLLAPGRDPRDDLDAPILRSDVLKLSDLKEGMALQGTVRNVVDFGAFVDVGVKQDGLVHISKLSKKFVKHPSDVVAVGEIVNVWVESVDTQTGRIGLTMIEN